MTYEAAPTRIVQLTPPGRGAIATILVEGPDAWQQVAGQFRSPRGAPLDQCPAAIPSSRSKSIAMAATPP